MSLKVLYAEDEPFLSRIVSDGLKSSGYTVQVIDDGNLVMDAYHSLAPDICILDIMLPSKDGYMLAQELRKVQKDLPIIFLSAKVLTEDVVKGFKMGGNDYLKKPFSMEELLVRMEALLQRFGAEAEVAESNTVYTFGHCQLDTVHQKLRTSTGEYSLSFKESALLEMMILRKNDVLERDEALLKIWGDNNYYNTRSMDVFMTHLRKLLKDEPDIQIMNLRSIGYKMIC
ncbi:response regulator transcription factor [Pedobacter hartonius]|uniref:DNA-binding response regulator, OmpR family, contains REC and winged-helix (WHTH) domain n=1 Tax=Pedobacter hartonius TaxID=425514 RepID=A0A1H4G9D6_9SPHI|nr:response regulator transcription factor [Pedobacter hartonius]SEB06057.1 DNA-binding response regulator, OmpR family, contains REC and winged-helix (wHTH) domain [Pedobacter hartonius]